MFPCMDFRASAIWVPTRRTRICYGGWGLGLGVASWLGFSRCLRQSVQRLVVGAYKAPYRAILQGTLMAPMASCFLTETETETGELPTGLRTPFFFALDHCIAQATGSFPLLVV